MATISGTVACAVSCGLIGCSGLLDVPTSPDVSDPSALQSRAGAEAKRNGALFQFADALVDVNQGQILESAQMSDELFNTVGSPIAEPVDQRRLPSSNPIFSYTSDFVMVELSLARLQAEAAIPALRQHAMDAPPSEVGELFAVIGYTELIMAEDFCNGIPISHASENGQITFGVPLQTDSVYGLAIAAFDSALAFSRDSVRIANFAAVGKGRALVDRRQYAAAASAVVSVPPDFAYAVAVGQVRNILWSPFFVGSYSMTDNEGGNGLPFISANDPRLVTEVAGVAFDGVTPIVYPAKYPTDDSPITISNGIEAKLIVAEAALAAGDVAGWRDTLNALRTVEGGVAGLAPIADPGATAARVDTLFTERAFWMFGTGHRLGDLRRLVRQYGRDQSAVFPAGPYLGLGGGTYGSDVNFPVPNIERTNPNFHGCLDRAA